ncbi:creatininase family protein [Fimbriiglobus ruber]|uniref:Creatinine amidohydrolase n=1 Tax=Fimbriiglobus ruber TaxID=1908690 RepID=A0A225DB30_9BACT|nr:creatininase family protein [Fimbriiglobus ruber]OWK34506.1 Creatinine amidohydrolase [Fimbriiglobus ruber]
MTRSCAFFTALLTLVTVSAQPAAKPAGRNAPRPIEGQDTVFVEEMTWMEVRDALAAGKTTVIVPTGGVEQNGPFVVTGKHNYIIRATAEAIARKLGNTLVAPVVAFVPEGNLEPPSGHMKYPGTISLTEDTYERLLTDICLSFRAHGFREIVLIGDSGDNQHGMQVVADRLNAKWGAADRTRVRFIPEYYNYDEVDAWLEKNGVRQMDEGLHDDFAISAMLAAVDPNLVRARQRQATGKFKINGVDLAPVEKTAEWGRAIIKFRTDMTVAAIRKAQTVPKR